MQKTGSVSALIGCLLLAGSVFVGCGAEPIQGCDIGSALEPFCDPPDFGLIVNPEDLAPLPEYARAMIVSQLGSMDGAKPGKIAAFNPYNGVYRHIFPLQTLRPIQDPEGKHWDVVGGGERWGSEACPGPPDPTKFSPHGIDLEVRSDGRTQLAVVNHGGRESIELLEILPAGGFSGALWRGCVLAPEGAFFNDVVWLPGGGLAVTHMYERTSSWLPLAAMFGYETGFVYEWQPDTGFTKLPGTEGAFPNGIEVSHDGSEIFVNLYGAGEVRRVVRATGEVTGTAEITRPDNVTWNETGTKLLVASHSGSLLSVIACGSVESGTCAVESQVVELDPASFQTNVLFETNGQPMGAVTVALHRRDDLWLGTFAGDRLGRVWLTPEGKPEALIAIEEALGQQEDAEPLSSEESSP